MSEDDAFGSNPATGKIVYRFPPVHELLGVPETAIYHYDTMSFIIEVEAGDEDFGIQTLACKTQAKCRIYFKRTHTPIVYGLSPPVVHHQAETDIWFDPRQVTNLIKDLPSDDLPFINSKIDGRFIDFETHVDFESKFS